MGFPTSNDKWGIRNADTPSFVVGYGSIVRPR